MTVKQNKQKDREQRKKDESVAKLNDLPNTIKFAAESLKILSERGGSAGSIVVNKYKKWNYKHIYAYVMNTVKNIKIIKKIIHEAKLAKKVPIDDPFLMEILVGELLFGRGLKSVEQNPKAAAIIGLKDVILKQQAVLKKEFSSINADRSASAKYLRINHLKSNMDNVLNQLKAAGLAQVDYSKDKIKFKKFINKFKSLGENEFMLDFHFPNDLIILKPEAVDKANELIRKRKVMLQDKASFMAVEALDVRPNQKIIDACCAPGGKTSLIANKMKNKGKILAYDVDKKRLLTAIHLLKVHGATCVKTEIQDFTKVKLKRLLKVHNVGSFDSILIDPSCSGSGITSRIDYKTSTVVAGRLKKLQAFQVSMLKHALTSKISDSIVYCTCSTSVEENEQVVEMALNESGVKSDWNIVKILPYWQQRGEANYEFGDKCLRSDENSLTNGFFIAKLKRNELDVPTTSGSEPVRKENKEMSCDEEDEEEEYMTPEGDLESESDDQEDEDEEDSSEEDVVSDEDTMDSDS